MDRSNVSISPQIIDKLEPQGENENTGHTSVQKYNPL